MIHLNKDQVARKEHEQYDPGRHDVRWNGGYTECDVIPLKWWDESSYADYQGDPLDQQP